MTRRTSHMTTPAEWANVMVANLRDGVYDMADPNDRRRLREWLQQSLHSYLQQVEADLQRAAALGVGAAIIQATADTSSDDGQVPTAGKVLPHPVLLR